MTMFADSTNALHPAAEMLGRTLSVQWNAVRRACEPDAQSVLERVSCVLDVTLITLHTASIECRMEVGGQLRRSVLPHAARACQIACSGSDAALVHIDLRDQHNRPLLAMTLEPQQSRLVYVRFPLLHDAGMCGGTYDPPTLCIMPARCIAQTA